jgi:hypothetical protein
MNARSFLVLVVAVALSACGDRIGGFASPPPGASISQSALRWGKYIENPCDHIYITAASGSIHRGQKDGLSVYEKQQNYSGFECKGPIRITNVSGPWSSNSGHLYPTYGHTIVFWAWHVGSYTVKVRIGGFEKPASTTITVD